MTSRLSINPMIVTTGGKFWMVRGGELLLIRVAQFWSQEVGTNTFEVLSLKMLLGVNDVLLGALYLSVCVIPFVDCSARCLDPFELGQWENEWLMKFNGDKCKMLVIYRKHGKSSYPYYHDEWPHSENKRKIKVSRDYPDQTSELACTHKQHLSYSFLHS